MSVKKEASGRRSVQFEVEVPGTPEEVWPSLPGRVFRPGSCRLSSRSTTGSPSR